jgi:hypothetical protein
VAKHRKPGEAVDDPNRISLLPKHAHSGWAILNGVIVNRDLVMVKVVKYLSPGGYLVKGMNQEEYAVEARQLMEVNPMFAARDRQR